MHYNTAKANAADQKDQRKALRSNMTPAEATLWSALKGRGAGGLKFLRPVGSKRAKLERRRQQGIGPYVLDFYCPERRLCVEVDGSAHDYRYDYDEQRTLFLAQQGIRVVRFRNEQVFTCLNGVVAEIVRAAGGDTDPTPVRQDGDTDPPPVRQDGDTDPTPGRQDEDTDPTPGRQDGDTDPTPNPSP